MASISIALLLCYRFFGTCLCCWDILPQNYDKRPLFGHSIRKLKWDFRKGEMMQYGCLYSSDLFTTSQYSLFHNISSFLDVFHRKLAISKDLIIWLLIPNCCCFIVVQHQIIYWLTKSSQNRKRVNKILPNRRSRVKSYSTQLDSTWLEKLCWLRSVLRDKLLGSAQYSCLLSQVEYLESTHFGVNSAQRSNTFRNGPIFKPTWVSSENKTWAGSISIIKRVGSDQHEEITAQFSCQLSQVKYT